jgi:PIN domain-containing protein
MRQVFIDTNVYLEFFRFGQDDLEELRKVRVAIENSDVTLWTTTQASAELKRNREARVAESLDVLRKLKPGGGVPQMARNLPEFGAFMSARREFELQLNALEEKLTQQFDARALAADSVLEELMGAASTVEVSGELFEAARRRVETGNPPGKRSDLGDAINWECLLEACPTGQDLYVITQDGDFVSRLQKDRFSAFLADEWRAAKSSEVRLYKRIAAFFQDHFPDIHLATELEKEIRVRRLIESTSFDSTHSAIAALAGYTDYTAQQANDLFEAALNNTQIRWISHDPDVNAFFVGLIDAHRDGLDPDELERFDRYFALDDEDD